MVCHNQKQKPNVLTKTNRACMHYNYINDNTSEKQLHTRIFGTVMEQYLYCRVPLPMMRKKALKQHLPANCQFIHLLTTQYGTLGNI